MKKILAFALGAMLLASCAPEKNVYLFTSFLEPSVSGMNYLQPRRLSLGAYR